MDQAYWRQDQQQRQQQHPHPQQLPPPWPALVPSPPAAAAGASPHVPRSHPPHQSLGYGWHHGQSERSPNLPYHQQRIARMQDGAAGMYRNTPSLPPRPYISGGGREGAMSGAPLLFASSIQPGMLQQPQQHQQAVPFVGLFSSAGQFGPGSSASCPPPPLPPPPPPPPPPLPPSTPVYNNLGNSNTRPLQTATTCVSDGRPPLWQQHSAAAFAGGAGRGQTQGGWVASFEDLGNEGAGCRPTTNVKSNTRAWSWHRVSPNRSDASRSQNQQQPRHHHEQRQQQQQQQWQKQQRHHQQQQQQQQQQQHRHHHHHHRQHHDHVPWHELHQQKRQSRKQRHRAGQKEARKLRSRPSLPSPPPASAACMKTLGLVAVSGFVRVSEGLEGTCVELSNACREGASWSVTAMRYEMLPLRPEALRCDVLPLRLQRFWPRGFHEQRLLDQLPQSRLIERRVIKSVGLVNNDPVEEDFIWPVGVEAVRFNQFNRDLGHVSWPPTMREIRLASRFSQPIEHVVWPESLRVLHLGDMFNCPVEDIALPDGLQEMSFSWRFNHPIARVRWPSQLRLLEFGSNFNRPLEGVTWPEALKEIRLEGDYFNQPIHVTPLPRDLEVLRLGDAFDQPLDNVVWPKGLKKVAIGYGFTGGGSPQLANIVWPSGLQEITAPAVHLGRLPKGCQRNDIFDPGDELDYFMFGNVFDPWWLGGAGMFEMLGMGVWDSDSE